MKLNLGFNTFQVLYKCDRCNEITSEPNNHKCIQKRLN
jgi:hypothetical protein